MILYYLFTWVSLIHLYVQGYNSIIATLILGSSKKAFSKNSQNLRAQKTHKLKKLKNELSMVK